MQVTSPEGEGTDPLGGWHGKSHGETAPGARSASAPCHQGRAVLKENIRYISLGVVVELCLLKTCPIARPSTCERGLIQKRDLCRRDGDRHGDEVILGGPRPESKGGRAGHTGTHRRRPEKSGVETAVARPQAQPWRRQEGRRDRRGEPVCGGRLPCCGTARGEPPTACKPQRVWGLSRRPQEATVCVGTVMAAPGHGPGGDFLKTLRAAPVLREGGCPMQDAGDSRPSSPGASRLGPFSRG